MVDKTRDLIAFKTPGLGLILSFSVWRALLLVCAIIVGAQSYFPSVFTFPSSSSFSSEWILGW